jgi:hypothetical protein
MELKKRVLNLKFGGKDYSLSFPTVRQLKDLSVKKQDETELDMTVRFLVELGLPEEVILDMEPDHVQEVVSVLTGQKKS